ncbi:MAG TPA: hypothetical protein VF487_02685 [Chitinophagaceae bacterium]
MKICHRIIPLVVFLFTTCLSLNAQNKTGIDSTGLPGDNFSLQGTLEMFQKAGSPEEFERLLNTQDNNVNNLDLNEDGEIDFVRVIDKMDKDVHALVLQVAVSEKENQDIAVIEIEKTGPESAMLQIIGDKDIYGEEVIVEPDGDAPGSYLQENTGNKNSGPNASLNNYEPNPYIIVNVWRWPSVRFIYAPAYRPWVSPWRWRYYPTWWHPWKPYAWHIWHPRHIHHHSFVVVHTHRVVRAHAIYKPVRVTSVAVRTRHSVAVNNYRVNRTRTTITGPGGHSASRTTTIVRGKKGKVRASKTTVKRRRG